jgi:hypothetical protein
VHFRLYVGDQVGEDFDYLQLDGVVAILGALHDSLSNSVNEFAGATSVFGGGLLICGINTVVGAVSHKALVGIQLLDASEDIVHQARQARLQPHLQDVEILVRLLLSVLVDLFYTRT